MPAARVSVQTTTGRSLRWKRSSTARRYFGRSPAWWTPTPRWSNRLSLGPAAWPRSSALTRSWRSFFFSSDRLRSLPMTFSATLQHSSRSKQKTRAGVRGPSSPAGGEKEAGGGLRAPPPPPPRHHDELFVEELVGHPFIGQRHPAFLAL